ncbi:glycosyltransferase [Candidatus Peregrinibacteria bacterium]|nr:glycosyltransferase [Candidatus Peregrinibacteria bacterium]MBI3816646.1 glycosyltransferase [Candidatus Peregrinibacteria bacterium]
MHITYVAHTRFPTEKAHGFQIASICGALAHLGHSVILLTPRIANAITQDAFEYYGLEQNFAVSQLPSFDALSSSLVPGSLAFLVSMMSYRKKLREYLARHATDLFYTRSPSILPPLLASGIPAILELHTLPRMFRRHFVALCNRCLRIVCLTSPMRDALVSWGVDPSTMIVEADAVDLSRFEHLPSMDEAKEEWDLPCDVPIIGYVGSLMTQEKIEKGVSELIDACAILHDRDRRFRLWIVGGQSSAIDRLKQHAVTQGLEHCARFEGSISATRVPSALVACDICVYPAPKSSHPYFQRDTSPLKMFEYLAARRPIVCADLPPIRDIVDEDIVRFCRPGDPQSLAHAIIDVLDHPSEASMRAQSGWEVVQHHSWEERMGRILDR